MKIISKCQNSYSGQFRVTFCTAFYNGKCNSEQGSKCFAAPFHFLSGNHILSIMCFWFPTRCVCMSVFSQSIIMLFFWFISDLQFQCLATWFNGEKFLYGKFTGPGLHDQSQMYRCFVRISHRHSYPQIRNICCNWC